MHFEKHGNGSPLVLIHGFCEDRRVWSEIVPKLEKEHTVITIDMPGFGKSPLQNKESYTSLEDMANNLAALLTQQKITECTMIGHSMGGYLTLAFAEKHPDMLSGLGMFHSTAFADSDFKKENRQKHIDFVNKNGVEPFVKTLIPTLFATANQQSKQAEKSLQIAKECSPKGVTIALKAMRDRKDRTDVLKNSKVPVLFIAGDDDKVVLPKDMALQASYPAKSQFELLRNSGHMGMFEEPERSIEIIEKFMDFVLLH